MTLARSLVPGLLAALVLSCGAEPAVPAPDPPADPAPGPAEAASEGGGPARPAPAAPADGRLTLARGFSPDPQVARGEAGGVRAAVTLDAHCAGFVEAAPDHELALTSYVPWLRILAHSEEDVSLIVQKPDGSFLCNSDAEGTDPWVTTAAPPGRYRIWVGTSQLGATAPYRLGLTQDPRVLPSRLADDGAGQR